MTSHRGMGAVSGSPREMSRHGTMRGPVPGEPPALARPCMESTSSTLLERLRSPDAQESWTRFVHLYAPLIFRWARRMGASPDAAADLVQDVLTTLVRKLPEFAYDRTGSFRGWLKVVTLNAWRQMGRARALPRGPNGAGHLDDVAAPDETGLLEEAEYRRDLVARALRLMQAEFQPTTWRACWECTVEDRPAREVADELGISVNAVYLAKSRVIRRLHQELRGLLD